MSHPEPVTLVQKLVARLDGTASGPAACARQVPVTSYTDPQRFEREMQELFLGRPLLIGHESQIPGAGDTLTQDWLGLPLITLRDKEGAIRFHDTIERELKKA